MTHTTTNVPAKRPSLAFRLLVRFAPPVAEAILVAAGGVIILLAPAVAAGAAAHAAAWCLRLGHLPLARSLGAATGLLAGLVTIARLVHEQVLGLGLGKERAADHGPAIARLNAAAAPQPSAEAITASCGPSTRNEPAATASSPT